MADDRPRPRYTVGPSVERYFRRNLRHHKGPTYRQPFVLDPWQREDVDLIFEVDEHGRRMWTTVLYGVARGAGKSPMASGFGLLELESRKDNPEIVCLSGASDQAKHVLEPARWNVEHGPLSRRLRPLRNVILCRGRPGKMEVLSSDGNLQHGRSISVGIVDEWHGFTTEKQREAYNAVATALHKRPRSVELAITTAGFDQHTQLGERYSQMLKAPDVWHAADGCTTIARDFDSRMLMIWRGAPEGASADDPAVWAACNPASWLDLDDLRIQRRKLPEGVFRRLHLNQWTQGEKAIWPAGAWARLAVQGLTLSAGRPRIPVWLGVDVGLKRDCAAVATVWKAPDGRYLLRAKVWQPVGDGTPLDMNLIAEHIQAVARANPVMEVAYDPRFFVGHAQALSDSGLLMVEAPQSPERMAPASQRFFDLVIEGKLGHDGDPTLARHVAAAATTPVGDGAWRFSKRKASDVIDALMASVFAIDRAANASAQPWAVIP